MRQRTLAGSVAAALALLGIGLPAVPAAAADDASTLFVNRTDTNCSDAGRGAAAQPYCTIAAAARAVQPGQTVMVLGTFYSGPVTITQSGTPGHPITFTTAYTDQGDRYRAGAELFAASLTAPALTISGAHDVVVQNFALDSVGSQVLVKDSARIVLDHDSLFSNYYVIRDKATTPPPAVHLTGSTSGVTVSRNVIQWSSAQGVLIDPGVSGTVVTTNEIASGAGSAIAATDAPGTVVTSNSLSGNCGPNIVLAGNSSGSTVENNIADRAVTTSPTPSNVPNCATPVQPVEISLSAGSVPGTTVDYNLVHPAADGTAYSWAGQSYATPAQLAAATGQGAHDLDADPLFAGDAYADLSLGEGSPAIDSADSNATGELAADLIGNPVVDDPNVANSGTGSGTRDRGAFERQGLANLKVALTGGPGPYPLPVTATASVDQRWPIAVSYTFDFGDGSAPVVSSSATVTHVYAGAGRYPVTVTATGPDGDRQVAAAGAPAVVNPPAPLVDAFTVKQQVSRPLDYVVDTSASSSPWTITSTSVDFGDGSGSTSSTEHTYSAPGLYTVSVTLKDAGGRVATTSHPVQITYPVSRYWTADPRRVLDTRDGTGGVPAAQVPAGGSLTLTIPSGQYAAMGIDYGTSAVVMNVTAVDARDSGFLSVGPGGGPRPTSSNINYAAAAASPNLVTVRVGASDTVTFWNSGGSPVDVVADLVGQYNSGYGDRYTPVAPTRIMDTRDGTGGVPVGKIGGPKDGESGSGCGSHGEITTVGIIGTHGVPANASAVVLNVTVTQPDQDGYLGVFGSAGAYATTSNLNYAAGQTVSNQVIVPVDNLNKLAFCSNTGKEHVVADLFGYYSPDGQDSFTPVDPSRLLDTRNSASARLAANGQLSFQVAGTPAVPAGADAAVLNLTSTGSDTDSFLTAYADGAARPGTSNVNFAAGQTIPDHATVPIGADGRIAVYNHGGNTDVVADLFGYFSKP